MGGPYFYLYFRYEQVAYNCDFFQMLGSLGQHLKNSEAICEGGGIPIISSCSAKSCLYNQNEESGNEENAGASAFT